MKIIIPPCLPYEQHVIPKKEERGERSSFADFVIGVMVRHLELRPVAQRSADVTPWRRPLYPPSTSVLSPRRSSKIVSATRLSAGRAANIAPTFLCRLAFGGNECVQLLGRVSHLVFLPGGNRSAIAGCFALAAHTERGID